MNREKKLKKLLIIILKGAKLIKIQSARTLADAIEIRIRNVSSANITTTTAHNWGYLVIR